MLPCISSANCLAIAIPRPVPSTFLLRRESKREKLSNRCARLFFDIPMPVSVTFTTRFNDAWSIKSQSIVTIMWPFSVYFTAFVTILLKSCLTRCMSPIM